ncbi:helicase associated domain-containing protein, partial [Planktomarina temperata]|nr:helicase associated domain-containing protein [Planktomarina temperata]
SDQRKAKDRISPERTQRLEDIGFVWDHIAEQWEEGFSKLLQLNEAEGHCRVPAKFKLDGFNLGQWVSDQRKAKDRISPERRQRLDDVGFVWDTLTEAWEEGFSNLLQFQEVEGHCNVPAKFKLNGFNLGKWVSHQRTGKDSMSPERKQRLDAIGFVWDNLTEAWEAGFSKLLQFKEAEGHCRVLKSYKLEGFNLGQWVLRQRTNKDSMSPERKQRLDDISFIWDPFTEAWEEGFSKLVQFKKLEGHCRVPKTFKLDGFNLGSWVGSQRTKRDSISPERKQRLDDIGFVWMVGKDKT